MEGGKNSQQRRVDWHSQIVFTRKPARGDHVGSRLRSYPPRLCSQLMTFSPHAKPSVHDPSNLGNLLFFLKLCLIEILFGVSLSVTSSLSCPEAKIVKLRIAGLSECVLRASPLAVESKLANLPQLLISSPLPSPRLRASSCSSFGFLPAGYF